MISFSQYVWGWRQRELPMIRDLNKGGYGNMRWWPVAGSSGSGKSLAHAVMGLLPQNAVSGTVFFEGNLEPEEEGTARGAGWYWSPERIVSDPL